MRYRYKFHPTRLLCVLAVRENFGECASRMRLFSSAKACSGNAQLYLYTCLNFRPGLIKGMRFLRRNTCVALDDFSAEQGLLISSFSRLAWDGPPPSFAALPPALPGLCLRTWSSARFGADPGTVNSLHQAQALHAGQARVTWTLAFKARLVISAWLACLCRGL